MHYIDGLQNKHIWKARGWGNSIFSIVMENIVKDKHGWNRWSFKPNSCNLTKKWKKVNVRNVKHDSLRIMLKKCLNVQILHVILKMIQSLLMNCQISNFHSNYLCIIYYNMNLFQILLFYLQVLMFKIPLFNGYMGVYRKYLLIKA
jgi:hypothetical protein